MDRLKVIIHGAVQGVGFRPFIYRLSTELGLRGWVLNSSQGVFIEVEGERPVLEEFLLCLEREKPPLAVIHSLEFCFLDLVGYPDFVIRHSQEAGEKTVLMATAATIIPSLTAPTVVPALPSSGRCPTTGPTLPWPISPSAPTATGSTRTPWTGASTPNR
jgi:acylphosphatase